MALNIPLTFPTPDIKGKVVAGGVLPAGRSYTHPAELQQELDQNAPVPGQRDELDDVSDNGPSRSSRNVRRDHGAATEVVRVPARHDRLGFAVLVYVSTDRIQHCLMEYVSPDHPKYEELKDSPVAKQTRARLPAAGRGSRPAPEAHRRRRSRDVDVGSRSPALHACMHDGPDPRPTSGSWSSDEVRSAYNLIRWGPGRRIARRIYDLFKLHGEVSMPASPIDWERTRGVHERRLYRRRCLGQPQRPRAGRHRGARGLRAGCATSSPSSSRSYVDPDTGRNPIGKVLRKEEVLSGPVPRHRSRPAAGAGAPLFADARQERRRGRRLALRRSPPRGRSSWRPVPRSETGTTAGRRCD